MNKDFEQNRLASLDPLDRRLIEDIKLSQDENQYRGFTNQPVVGDPYDLTPSNYSYVSNNVVQTTASEINRWQKGDRVLIRQSATDKTFFVINVNKVDNRITVNAGSVNTYTNNAIERIQIAPVRVIPPGYVATYQFPGTLTVDTGSISNIGYTRREFAVLGDICDVWFTAFFDIGGGGAVGITLTLPIPGSNLGNISSTYLGSALTNASTFTPMAGYVASLSGSDYTQVFIIPTMDIFEGLSQSVSTHFSYKIV